MSTNSTRITWIFRSVCLQQPTPYFDPIVFYFTPTLLLLDESDILLLLEEAMITEAIARRNQFHQWQKKALEILGKLSPGPTGGHYGANFTAKKVFDAVELRDQAYENSLIYKEKTKKLHDSKIKNRIFNVGDQVLLFNSRLKIFSGKLKSRWSGPFTITEVYPYGTAKLSHADGSNFKVNCHRLKHYYGGDTPPLVIQDLQTFPKDN
ncbi:hypothetical protein Tco_0966732 [Tanacetum coccineum]